MKSELLTSVLEGDGNLFYLTKHVNLELSNLCNYGNVHKKCPVNKLQAEHNIIPSKIIYDVFSTLERFKYSRMITFCCYNEPLIDPRLFEFVRAARKACPDSIVRITSNGFYLNQSLALELVDAGVTSLGITAYTPSEVERLKKIHLPIHYAVMPSIPSHDMDDRLGLYGELPLINLDIPCLAPLFQIIVNAKGRVVLCCYDWKGLYTYGDLNNQSLEDIMKNPKMWIDYGQLSKGERILDICRRCKLQRT